MLTCFKMDTFVRDMELSHTPAGCWRRWACAAAIVLAISTPNSNAYAAIVSFGDVTDQLVNHGNRLLTDGGADPARPLRNRELNVWDLQSYQGKVYLGGGNTTTNPGPINLWAFDHNAGSFGATPEREIQAEAIEKFRVFNGNLYVPNSDPTFGDSVKFDRLSGGTWQTVSSTPNMAHIRDISQTADGRLALVGNSRAPFPSFETDEDGNRTLVTPAQTGVVTTADDGATFQTAIDTGSIDAFGNFFFSTFTYDDRTFATTLYNTGSTRFTDFGLGIMEFDPQSGQFVAGIDDSFNSLPGAITREQFIQLTESPFPGAEDVNGEDLTSQIALFVEQSVEIGDSLIYSVATHSPYQSSTRANYYRNTAGFYYKTSVESDPTPVTFADPDAVGEDVLLRDGVAYALANARQDDGSYIVYVYATTDPSATDAWQEVLRFDSGNLVRSFEEVDDTFYFGLGYDALARDNIADAGTLLSVRTATAVPEPSSWFALAITGLVGYRRRRGWRPDASTPKV